MDSDGPRETVGIGRQAARAVRRILVIKAAAILPLNPTSAALMARGFGAL